MPHHPRFGRDSCIHIPTNTTYIGTVNDTCMPTYSCWAVLYHVLYGSSLPTYNIITTVFFIHILYLYNIAIAHSPKHWMKIHIYRFRRDGVLCRKSYPKIVIKNCCQLDEILPIICVMNIWLKKLILYPARWREKLLMIL